MPTRIGQVAQEITRMNPWWRSPRWAETDTDLRHVQDSGLGYRSPCLDDLRQGGLYLLRGPRRVGKTVSVKQAIESLLARGVPPLAIVRFAADGWMASDLRTLIQNVALPPAPQGTTRWWFIDEVTAVKGDWATQLKWLRDNEPGFADATVVLTGSNAEGLTSAAGTLAGRRGRVTGTDRTLLPMGFRTFARLLVPELEALPRLAVGRLHTREAAEAYQAALPWLDDLVRLWEVYLQYGGFPAAVAAARQAQPVPGWFVDDLFSVLHRDAFAASRLSESQTSALVARLWGSMAAPVNSSRIGADVDVSHDAVARHIGYLRDSYLLWSCPQTAGDSYIRRERSPEKLYAIDPIIARLAHLRNPARHDVDVTVLAEMQVGMALRRATFATGWPWTADEVIFYHRTKNRKEIDFVGEPLAGTAVEGKYVETGRWRGEAAVIEASEWSGILTTRNVLDCTAPDSTWAVPAGMLAALADT
ncbi:MAG: ATP-binding protein [Nocardiopsaceae bacterium]|nr:ATP-binding protein [Nocardiopsaceae bacterium]